MSECVLIYLPLIIAQDVDTILRPRSFSVPCGITAWDGISSNAVHNIMYLFCASVYVYLCQG